MVVLFWKESYYWGIRIIAKFVVLCCAFANFKWVFLFRQSFELGGVNANHNSTHSLGLASKNKTENDFRLLKNSEANRDDEWHFCRGQEADMHCFNILPMQETRIRKFRKSWKKTFQSIIARNRAITETKTKWIEMQQSQLTYVS